MKIDDLIKALETAKKTWNNNLDIYDIYIEIDEDEDCPTCGEPQTHIYDAFAEKTEVMSVDSIPTFTIFANRDAERQK